MVKEHCRYAVNDFRPLIVGEDEDKNQGNSDDIVMGDDHIITAGSGSGLAVGSGLASGQGLAVGKGLGLENLRMLDLSSDDSGESKSKVLEVEGSKEGLGVNPHSIGSVVAPPSPPRNAQNSQSSQNSGYGSGHVAVVGSTGLAGLLTQRVSVSRENSFGFFDPLTRACFQGHLR